MIKFIMLAGGLLITIFVKFWLGIVIMAISLFLIFRHKSGVNGKNKDIDLEAY